MKVVITLILCTILIGCGANSEIENDARRAAKLFCEASKMVKRAASYSDNTNIMMSTSLSREASDLFEKLSGKYTNASDARKFLNAYNKAISNCY
ncbi:MAG: hypothetical protein JNK69_03545 [Saprospiraceae bacterium]|nr:hypothetical protein [Saprospiraceae bacterium]